MLQTLQWRAAQPFDEHFSEVSWLAFVTVKCLYPTVGSGRSRKVNCVLPEQVGWWSRCPFKPYHRVLEVEDKDIVKLVSEYWISDCLSEVNYQ